MPENILLNEPLLAFDGVAFLCGAYLSDMYNIQSRQLNVSIAAQGAELKSVYNKETGLEYMWSADPAFWAKTSPVLFPIVGALKDGKYNYNGKEYRLPRHGFAREKEFEVTEQSDNSITFALQSNEETEKVYPFAFLFSLQYIVQDNVLTVSYTVKNTGDEEMFFSIGGHPAFGLPLVDGTEYSDYMLRFETKETAGRWPISKDGLIQKEPQPLLKDANELRLSKDLFKADAVVLKHLRSTKIDLVSDKTPHGLSFLFDGFPYLGLWAAPGADFLCIEPWCGIADSVEASGELKDKEGINKLEGGKEFSVAWMVKFY